MSQEFTDSSFADVEAEMCTHPKVQECAVTEIQAGSRRKTLTAYVVTTGRTDVEELRAFLSARLPSDRIPQAVVTVRSLPRTEDGEVDYAGLPLPVHRGRAGGGKGGWRPYDDDPELSTAWKVVAMTLIAAFLAFVLTNVFWPHSTDLSGVPQPWATLFLGLYICECLSFGLGGAFLFFGRELMARQGRPPWLTTLAYLAVAWLLMAWWPQDNFYRLAAKTDWPRQAALVYGFNITLMVAAAAVAAYVATKPGDQKR
jgi:hypothetical protein